MTMGYICQRCSHLPPPPPIFSIKPPPDILSIDVHCTSRLLSSSSSVQHIKVTSSSSSLSVALGIVIALLISTGTILFIKNRMIKRRRERQRDSSLSAKFNGHNHDHHHHHHQNWTKFIPLLNDSCSSDRTMSTPPSEYPCLTNDLHHEYEQIKYDNSAQYYCLVYCHQCATYHHTSPSLCPQPGLIRSCTCHLRNDNHLFELQPMLTTNNDDLND